jgi:lipopolysaccharide/colanic/teichoic acid biosynthesis glycosyltransferase
MAAKVLVVDDDHVLTELIRLQLLKEGYHIKTIHDGLSAIDLATSWRPDLILLDIMMPDMDGFEVCRRLREHDSTAHIPIVMLTAKTTISDKATGFGAGADDYITKPFDSTELKLRVAAHIRRVKMLTEESYVPARVVSVPLMLASRRSGLFRRSYRVAKRIFDIVVCLAVLPVALPIMLLIMPILWLDSPGSIFFVQKRTGLHGKKFNMYKFRTMRPDAEQLKVKYAHLNELTWPDFKITNDPRVTRVGKILRKTSLDELPQIFNILKGDMSLVGPRPTSFSADTYQLWQTERLEVRPGLTGLWQVRGRSNIDFKERVELDIEYIERQSWELDLRILGETIAAVILGRGAA